MNSITRRDAISAIALLGAGAIAGRISIADEGPEYRPALPGRPSPPRSTYGFESTAEEVTAGMNLSGTTVLVTGCNSGLGLETMRVLALRGAHVYGAARTVEKAETACASVDGSTTPIVVELTDLDSIVNAAEQVRSDDVALDALVLNAGIMALQELEQVRGVEKQFFVNHVGHFLLAEHLMDNVSKARQGRVVVVSSSAHQWAPDEGIQFDNLSGEVGYDPWRAYGQSKLANGLFSRELARRLADTDANPTPCTQA